MVNLYCFNSFQKVTNHQEYVLSLLLNACTIHSGNISSLDQVLLDYHKNPFLLMLQRIFLCHGCRFYAFRLIQSQSICHFIFCCSFKWFNLISSSLITTLFAWISKFVIFSGFVTVSSFGIFAGFVYSWSIISKCHKIQVRLRNLWLTFMTVFFSSSHMTVAIYLVWQQDLYSLVKK